MLSIENRWIGHAALITSVILLTGCSERDERPTPTQTPTAPPTQSPAARSEALPHYVPPGQTIIASLDDATGSANLGRFAVTTKDVFVYLSCEGPGVIRIVMDNVGDFPLDCSPSDPAPSTNQFQVSEIADYSVEIESQPGQRWAATVALPN